MAREINVEHLERTLAALPQFIRLVSGRAGAAGKTQR
jgi:hypothetical protein